MIDHAWQVQPIGDLVEHEDSDECICGPEVQFADEETGERYELPLIIHYALDGRE